MIKMQTTIDYILQEISVQHRVISQLCNLFKSSYTSKPNRLYCDNGHKFCKIEHSRYNLGLRPINGFWTPHPPLKSVRNQKLYYNQHKEVRLGGWGNEGPTLGRHASACATILSLCALLYQLACATILRLCALLYLRASHQCVRQYIVTSLERLGQVAGAMRARRARHYASK